MSPTFSIFKTVLLCCMNNVKCLWNRSLVRFFARNFHESLKNLHTIYHIYVIQVLHKYLKRFAIKILFLSPWDYYNFGSTHPSSELNYKITFTCNKTRPTHFFTLYYKRLSYSFRFFFSLIININYYQRYKTILFL